MSYIRFEGLKDNPNQKIEESSKNWHLEAKILFLVQVNSESQYF
jgi:hypothetical protein